ncbi:spondin-2 [Rhipicephalus sanguineus]|uniref:spondin-2 n=1 Tax=Rhipicephalus sanguineus TaxID=34632 RepID=UPI0020C4AB30|nr:spondin-2 [Rhipicephalus sanguineus]
MAQRRAPPSLRFALLLLLFWPPCHEACRGLAQYRVTLATAWTASRFPKQYPQWRPPAQWSQLFGVSHNASVHVWREGRLAGEGLRQFAEHGHVGRLSSQLVQGFGGVLDVFHGPAIAKGSGASSAAFFADARHSKVTAMSRLVPSPDWFVGVDGIELCEGGRWRDLLHVDAQLLDAGTDRGLTFTAPRWPSQPPENVTRITARSPSHPGAAFHYAHLEKLPRIGVFQFRKLHEYASHGDASADQPHGEWVTAEPTASDVVMPSTAPSAEPSSTTSKPPSENGSCQVSGWSAWSACSQTCGLGQSRRHRRILRYPSKGAAPCPPLHELRWCGSARTCRMPNTYFRWNR